MRETLKRHIYVNSELIYSVGMLEYMKSVDMNKKEKEAM